MATKSKAKGNAFEIKLSKLLSTWMFNNPDVLWRDSTSGGRKIIYNGDIIPAQVETFPWKSWPFIIESKHGYKEFIPTLMNQSKLRFWLSKLMEERTETQYIPILIAQFHRHPPIMVTTLFLEVYCDVMMKVVSESEQLIFDFFVYDFTRVLSTPFTEAVDIDLRTYLQR